MNLAGLSPFGPIFGKELRATSRRKRTYFLRFFYLGILLSILLMGYLEMRPDRYGSVVQRADQLARLGEVFFGIFAFFSVTAMAAFGPVLTSTAISSERLHKTLPVLLMTPLTSWQILGGKLFSRLLVSLTLLGLTLPVLAVVRLLGGVEITDMIAVVAVAAATALAAASVGLFLSTFINRAYATILLAYIALGILYLLIPLLMALMNIDPDDSMAAHFLALTNPFFVVAMMIEGARWWTPGMWVECVAFHVTMAGAMVFFSSLVLRRTARRLAEGGGAALPDHVPYLNLPPLPVAMVADPRRESDAPADPGTAHALASAGALPSHSPIPHPESRAPNDPLPYASARTPRRRVLKQREVSDAPVLWRELRRPLMPQRWQRLVGSIACVGLLLFIYALLAGENDLDHRDTHMGFAWVFNGLTTLMLCVLAGTSIATEKESDTWTLLLVSGVSGPGVVWGKVAGIMRRMLWPMALVVGHFLLFTIVGYVHPVSAVLTVWVIITFNVLFIATGVYLSLRLKKATTAVIVNLLLPVLMYGAVPLVLAIVGELVTPRAGDDAAEAVLVYLPYYYFYQILRRLPSALYADPLMNIAGYRGYYDDMTMRFEPLGYMSGGEFVRLTIAIGALHLLLAAGIVGWTMFRFNALVGRASQRTSLPPALIAHS